MKIGNEVVGFFEEETAEAEKYEFNAKLIQKGSYEVTQGTFIHLNESDTFWGDDVTIIIRYGDKKEEIKLE
ncbi:hypothetical protein CIB95_03845 [Lottiidibacillus patelloidae]|uniref:Uncharacterized protein n=1 Tax=Lottiidibacillus patelloidae TaxID=2670334 RepID=A0A263BY75_9BACI|nr:hypothetical protein [Lottiidibacillus patelloidae]OZM58711.1 hypothetical protein CIB95_03845 [Lottiidibacillus patelloidae]